jgi:hypothetical protein
LKAVPVDWLNLQARLPTGAAAATLVIPQLVNSSSSSSTALGKP